MSAERSTFTIRDIKQQEVAQLLELYRFLHPDDPVIEIDRSIQQLWESILNNLRSGSFPFQAASDIHQASLSLGCALIGFKQLQRFC
jgi:hypothetical protein